VIRILSVYPVLSPCRLPTCRNTSTFPIALSALGVLEKIKPSAITMEDNFQSTGESGNKERIDLPRSRNANRGDYENSIGISGNRRCKAKPEKRVHRVTHPHLSRIVLRNIADCAIPREGIWPRSIMRRGELLPQSLPVRGLEKPFRQHSQAQSVRRRIALHNELRMPGNENKSTRMRVGRRQEDEGERGIMLGRSCRLPLGK